MNEKEYKMNIKMKMKKFKKLSFSDKSITISGYVGVILFVLAIIIPLIL